MVSPFPEFVLEHDGSQAVLRSALPAELLVGPTHQAITASMSHWIAWGRQLTGIDFPVIEAHFNGPSPRDVTPWNKFFGGKLRFDAPDDIYVLDSATLRLPLQDSAPELGVEFEKLAEWQLDHFASGHWPEMVKELIQDELVVGRPPDVRRVAERLHVTTRTLHRRLSRDGTCFRSVKDELLGRRAKDLLSHTNRGLQEIAYELGYAEPSNFFRAFRRWTGVTPSRWRRGSQMPLAGSR